MDRRTRFFPSNVVSLLSILSLFFFSYSAFSDPIYGLDSCSKSVGPCYEDDTANGWANTSHLAGWASSDIQGWHANETADYRFNISLPIAGDAATYFVRVEQDHLQDGVVGVNFAKDFYVGAASNGQKTKHCTVISGGSSLPALPYQGGECVVAGPTFTGADDDGDGRVDEEILNGRDDDGDGLIDEDPMPDCASSTGAEHIQYTAAVHFDPDEAGTSSSNWALYWLAHHAVDSNNFPGGSVETRVRAHREGDPDDPPNQCPGTPDVPVGDAAAVYCNGALATIVGTPANQAIYGTSGDDYIVAPDGHYTIYGEAGNDTLCLTGNSFGTLYGNDGNDVLVGGASSDKLYGGAGDDQLFGEAGNDYLAGQDGDDALDGGGNSDKCFGGNGADTVTNCEQGGP